MNPETTREKPVWHIGLGFVVACLLFGGLVALVKFSARPPAIDAGRAAAISSALFEIHTNETALLTHPGWVDTQRGIVRLPIQTAMQMTERNWQNPAQARADLIAREEKASAPAPVAAPKPNEFE